MENKQKLYVLKIGGKVLADERQYQALLTSFAAVNAPKILVHGGGNKANEILQKLGQTGQMVKGRRVTDANALEVVTMVYAGLLNKKLVAQLQALGCNALGMSGADANAIQAVKRPPKPFDYGWVGDIEMVNKSMIVKFLELNITPVFSSITHDKKGQLLNTNADTVVTALAVALAGDYEVHLRYHFDKIGVLNDAQNETSFFKTIHLADYRECQENGIISEGMLPKLDNAFRAKAAGVHQVFIGQTQIV